ncbi:MAG: pyruvate ferredoxin oxidoreductase, partial [Candidatus Bathyarchaeia archaeon]
LWPFADEVICDIAGEVEKIVVLENNLGQIVSKVKEAAAGQAEVEFLPPKILSTIHEPMYVMDNLRRLYR